MKKNFGKWLAGLITTMAVSILFTATVLAANVTVFYVSPGRIDPVTAPQGSNMTYKGPTDINIPGYAFCGWSVPLANVQTNTVAYAIYIPIGSEGQMVNAYRTYTHLPTGVLGYSTASATTIPEATRNLKNPLTIVEKPTTLTAQQTIQLNPVGDPGKTCVVKWYNGSTGELWKTDIVPYGATLPAPATPCIPGLEFVGWDGSWTNINSDRNIIACFYKYYHVDYVCGNCGRDLGEKNVRVTEDLKHASKDIGMHASCGEFDHWEINKDKDPYVKMTAVMKSEKKEEDD